MKKELIIVASILALFVVGTFLFIPKDYITGNAISTITFPTDCSEANIKALWDSIFKESSEGISFSTNDSLDNGACDYIFAMKNISKTYYYLHIANETNQSLLLAKKVTYNATSNGYNLADFDINSPLGRIGMVLLSMPYSEEENRSSQITDVNTVSSNFSATFKVIPGINWISSSTYGLESNKDFFVHNETENYSIGGKNYSKSIAETVYKTIYDEVFIYSNVEREISSACTPNWTKQESACYANDTQAIFYTDLNNCNDLTGKPNSSVINCDNNSNGLIGQISTSQNSLNLSVYVAGNILNSSFNYSNSSSNRLVEIKNDGKTIISFMYSFSQPLVLNNITLKLNANSSTFGSIIINGLDEEKSVIFDKKNSSSSQVCVRDKYVSSISDISDLCEEDNEYLITCPGTSSGYSCNTSGNSFNVSGLEHSAVKEMLLTQTISLCVQNWSCTAWSNCTNFIKTRSCNDTARCNNLTGKPNITESCVPGNVVTPTCVPQWSCTEWFPEKCSGENQTRSCTDINKCNSNTNKPNETQKCSSSLKKYLLWATIILFSLLICLVIYFLISKYLPKKETPKNDFPQNNISPLPPVQPSAPTNIPNSAPAVSAPEIPDVK